MPNIPNVINDLQIMECMSSTFLFWSTTWKTIKRGVIDTKRYHWWKLEKIKREFMAFASRPAEKNTL